MYRAIIRRAMESLAVILGCGAAGFVLSLISGAAIPSAIDATSIGVLIGFVAVAVGLILGGPAAALERRLSAAAWAKTSRSTSPLGYMTERSPGYVEVARIGDVPVFVHWSLLFSGLLISSLGGLDFKRTFFYTVGYFLLIGAHEAGHVVAARSCRLKVFAVEISGVGGLCRVERPLRMTHIVLVYSAGLLAQVALMVFALSWLLVLGPPSGDFGRALLITFTVVNMILFVVNVIPFKTRNGLSTDGRILWQSYLHVFRGAPYPQPRYAVPPFLPPDQAPVFGPDTSLLSLPWFVPKGFVQGIEILNDRTTPMLLIVTLLVRHLRLSREEAVARMISIHNSGGVLIPMASVESAQRIAADVSAGARAAGHSLVCRAVVAK